MKEFFTGAFLAALVLIAVGISRNPIFYCWTAFTGVGTIVAWLKT